MVGRVDIISAGFHNTKNNIQSLRFSFYHTTHSFSRCAIYTHLAIYLCLVITPQQALYPGRAILKKTQLSSQGSPWNHDTFTTTDGPLHSTVGFFFCCKCSGETWVKLKSCLGPQDPPWSFPPQPRFFAALDAFCLGGGRRFLSAKS